MSIEEDGFIAKNLHDNLSSFNFANMYLIIFDKILGLTRIVSDSLQNRDIEISDTIIAINSTVATLNQWRSFDQWQLLWNDAVIFANDAGKSVSEPEPRYRIRDDVDTGVSGTGKPTGYGDNDVPCISVSLITYYKNSSNVLVD